MDIEERIAAAATTAGANVRASQALIAHELGIMRAAWAAATSEAEAMAAKGAVAASAAAGYEQKLAHFLTRFPAGRPGAVKPERLISPVFSRPNEQAGWFLNAAVTSRIDNDLKEAHSAAAQAAQRTFGKRFREEAQRRAGRVLGGIRALEAEARRLHAASEAALEQREAQAASLREAADAQLEERLRALADAVRRLPPAMTEWSSPAWLSWEPGLTHDLVLAGMLRPRANQAPGANHSFAWNARLPLFVSAREALRVSHPNHDRDAALGLTRSLLLRALACTPPGKLRLAIFDPTGLGQSVASLLELGEYDRELIGGKVWSSTDDLRRLLAEHSAHIELVIQKYLRAEYASLEDFNAAAGEIAEPYRLLVVCDAPTGLDESTLNELRRIVQNGPRCGVATIVVEDLDVASPYGVSLQTLPDTMRHLRLQMPYTHRGDGAEVDFEFVPQTDAEVPAQVVAAILERVGRGAQASTAGAVAFARTFELFARAALEGRKRGLPRLAAPVEVSDPETWWRQSTLESVAAPIGLRGARDVATLTFDSSDHAGALLVGRPGSGKSTLLHTFIAGITTMYGPDELELHLIDFKEGVEFKVYAAGGLPHARTVAIESDREFGVSVLQALQHELSWRGSLLRGSADAHASLEALRRATGERLPRIVLVFDEFQVLFARNDRLGEVAASVLETLIRQGRGFGIHVLLGSQSLSGLDALGSHVPQLLPVRILLPASEADAFKVLGEANTEGSALTNAGEGILNPAGGAVEANERFRGALISEQERRERVAAMRAKADASGLERRPVVFEGNAPIPADDTPPARFVDELRGADARTLRLRFGAPMAITGSVDLNLRRESGANVALVARDVPVEETGFNAFSVPRAVTANFVLSAVASGAEVEVVDFLPIDEGLETFAAPLLEAGVVRLSRRRQVPALLERIRAEIAQRTDEDDTSARTVFLVLHGMHRARDFDQDSIDYDAEADLPETLRQILRDGPEVGVHTYMWFDTVAAIARRLPSGAVREVSWRLAGKMSADDSSSFIGVEGASTLREQQLLSVNEERGLMQRCTAITEPPPAWIGALLSAVAKMPEELVE